MQRLLRRPLVLRLLRRPGSEKHAAELAWWRQRRADAGDLEQGIPYYRWMFTENFGLAVDFYEGKRLLDVGCGPRGSLEWADGAAERVGLDPLAERYAALRSRPHAMTYVAANAERIPFPDRYFDVVSTINSLDHVDDVDAVLGELARVAGPGATLLLIVDIEHEPTITEPHRLTWALVDRLAAAWSLVDRRDLERQSDNTFDNLQSAPPFDRADPRMRPGVLCARFERRG